MTVKFAFEVRPTTNGHPFKAITILPSIAFYNELRKLSFCATSQALTICLKKLAQDELKYFKKQMWERYPERFRDPLDGLDIVDLVDKMLEICDIEVSLKITLALFEVMNFKKLTEYLKGLCKRSKSYYFILVKALQCISNSCLKVFHLDVSQTKCATS